MELLDAWFIGKFEKFAHWFQGWTGKTNYFLCKVCYWFILALFLATFAMVKIPINFWGVLFLILILVDIAYLLPIDEKRSLERLENGVANPAKTAFPARFGRGMLFLLTADYLFLGIVTSPVHFLFSIYFGGFFCRFCFSACDPLPPCRGRVWDVIGAFFAKSATIEKES